MARAGAVWVEHVLPLLNENPDVTIVVTLGRSRPCVGCGVIITTMAKTGSVPKRCRECYLAHCCAEERKRNPPVLTVQDTCVDCGTGYARSSRATTRVRCEPCRTTYAKAQRAEYAKANPSVIKAVKRRWFEANRSYVKNAKHIRRVIERAEIERFTRDEIFERDEWICQLCGQPVDQTVKFPLNESPSLDHVIPLSLGGSHTRANSQLAHMGCNRSKGGRRG